MLFKYEVLVNGEHIDDVLSNNLQDAEAQVISDHMRDKPDGFTVHLGVKNSIVRKDGIVSTIRKDSTAGHHTHAGYVFL